MIGTNYPFPDYPPESYGAVLKSLTRLERIPPLGPGAPNIDRRPELERFNPEEHFGAPVKNPTMAKCCQSGLWLLHSFLDESHTISQDIHTAEGSYWHAIMHRREPDAMNSKYWFRQVGEHVVFGQLVQLAPKVGYSYTTPIHFVDFCERHRGKQTEEETIARWVQLLEWQLLFSYCYRGAVG
jgi:hypothetical protein